MGNPSITSSTNTTFVPSIDLNLFKAAFQNLPVFYYSVNRDGILTDLMGKGLERLQINPADLIGKNVYTDLNLSENIKKFFKSALRGESVTFEAVHEYNNIKYDYLTHLQPSAVDASAVVGFAVDQMDYRDAVQEASVQQISLQLIADHLNDVVWVSDLQLKRIQFVNKAYETIYGKSVQSLYDSPLSFLDIVHPDDRAMVYREVIGNIENFYSHSKGIEYRVSAPDRSMKWVWSRAYPIYDDEGDVCQVVGIVQDITERKLIESEILEDSDRLQKLIQERTKQLGEAKRLLRKELEERKETENALRSKNIALKEILSQIESEKRSFKSELNLDLNRLILPVLKKLKTSTDILQNEKLVELLIQNLDRIISGMGPRDAHELLTAKENEVADLIRAGLSTKDISKMLHISMRTVEVHRNRIRKKLGIGHKRVNLAAQLSKW